jgi:hypothetical protein
MLQTTSSGQGLYNDILSSSITKEKLSRVLLEKAAFSPVPRQDDQAWLQLDPQSKAFLVEKGEAYLDYDWPSLLARRYMDFDIDGNRTRYSSRYFERRDILADLCMAELAEGEGRFMDDIINGLWLILEESTWVVPAHSGGNKLHDKDDDYVDLFNAETAGLVAWIDYYFGESFDEITPLIRKRIYQEVKQRVIQPMLKHNDFWYMGYTGRIPNNWNPWIVSNWLSAVLLLEADQEVRIESCWKAMDVLDQYLNPHPADGGCDEGPSYWGHAGASLFDCLYLLNSASEGAIDVFDVPLIRNIGSYIYKINIANDWYVNFADGSAKGHHQAGTLYRVGQAIGDPEMMAFAAWQYRHHTDLDHHTGGRSPFGLRRVPNLMILDEVSNFNRDFQAELNYFFPDLEVAVMREFKSQSGFFAAIKGGYNKESHNHNDAGSFVVFYNGLPLLIDVGVGTYSRKTFSDERYTIWTMQSDYHNLPTLNGEMQQEGAEFKAEKFLIENDGKTSTVSMELQSAYPDYAYTTFWLRSFSLNRKSGKVILVDSWEQERQMKRNQWNFMLAYEPEILDDGLVRITNGKDKLYLKFKKHFFPKIEEIKLDDSRLQNVWGPSVWRLSLSTGKKGLRGKEEFTIQSRR